MRPLVSPIRITPSTFPVHASLKRLCVVMARQKIAPKKYIQKSTVPATRTIPSKPTPPKQSPLASTAPVQVFESDAGVRGDVIRINQDGERPLVVPASFLPPFTSTTQDESPAADCGQKGPVTHLVLLPGNPGVIEYYRQFLVMTCSRLPQDVRASVAVHALGLPGHDMNALNGSTTFGIAQHTDYVLSYLQSANLTPSLMKSNLVLVGHSYGAFLAMQVLDMLSPDVVSRTSLFYLMPCLWKMGECAGLVSRLLLRNPLQITTSSAWLATKLLPTRLCDYWLGTQAYPAGIEESTRKLLSCPASGLYRNICALAQDEMRSITTLRKYPAIRLVAGRTYMLALENDKWCPPEAVNVIKEAFDDKLTVEDPNQTAADPITHAFVLSYVQSEKVARIVSSWLTDLKRCSNDHIMTESAT